MSFVVRRTKHYTPDQDQDRIVIESDVHSAMVLAEFLQGYRTSDEWNGIFAVLGKQVARNSLDAVKFAAGPK